MSGISKFYIGKEDFLLQTNTDAPEQFERKTSVGGTMNLTKFPDIWNGTGKINVAEIVCTSLVAPGLSVNTDEIADGAVTTVKIADAAITTAKIDLLAVDTAQIADAAITNAKIGLLAVETAQIADGAIETAKIGNLQVQSAQIDLLTVATKNAAYYMASRGAKYWNSNGVTISDTTEIEIGTITAVTFELTDSVWLWVSMVIAQVALSTGKASIPVPIYFRLRRGSLTGLEVGAACSLGMYAASGEYPPIVILASDVPSTGTDDQCSGGTAAADSDFGAGYEADKAFDNNLATIWASTATACPHWIRYQLTSGKVITQYSICPRTGYLDFAPKDFKLQGSNNGMDFVDLDSSTGIIDWATGVEKYFSFTNSTSYTYYRIYVTANNGGAGGGVNMAEIQMFLPGTFGNIIYKLTAQAMTTPDVQSGIVNRRTIMALAKSR